MRLSGTLRTWDDQRGFGFIAPTHGGPELFVHISALPHDGTRPTVGERLSYESGAGDDGRLALNVWREAIGRPAHRAMTQAKDVNQGGSFWTKLIVGALLLSLCLFGWQQYQKRLAKQQSQFQLLTREPGASRVSEPVLPSFQCDGRVHCSQMRSCEEAVYFLRNCPGTKMDGDDDGIPCEQQWCPG